jgi:hypothetical protein
MSDNGGQVESPEGRLYAAGFTRRLEFWVAPDSPAALSLEGAIARLDSGTVKPPSVDFPDTGTRALPDELVALACPPPVTEAPDPPPWLLAQAEVIAQVTVAKMKPLIRAEVREAQGGNGRTQRGGPRRREPGDRTEALGRSWGRRPA